MVAVVMIWAPPMYDVLATYNDPCIPTPPATINAPVVVLVADVVPVINRVVVAVTVLCSLSQAVVLVL
jgi:hypothetical protein